MFENQKSEKIGVVSDACRWVAESLAAAPRLGEAEWHLLHPKVEKFTREWQKMLPQTASEEEKIALLQAAHDALYLLSGNVTHPAEQYYLAHALPVVTSYLDRHESEPVADGCPLHLAFLRLSLDLLYSSRFLSAANDTALADRLAAYTSRTLDTLRAATAPTPELQSLFAKEETLFEEV